MDDLSIRHLIHLNRRFYDRNAQSFADSRPAPWPGWDRVVLEIQAQNLEPLQVLDLGAGESRFFRFLMGRGIQVEGAYAVDTSLPLLAAARTQIARSGHRFHGIRADLLSPDVNMPVQGNWDLAVAFGLLHHIPGSRLRQLFVGRMADLVRPGGLLVLTFWDYLHLPRFQRRLASWEDYNRSSAYPIDLAQLEPGDTLLRWGKEGSEVRYCHQASDEEIDTLLAPLPCTSIVRYRADGHLNRLNRYVILQRD